MRSFLSFQLPLYLPPRPEEKSHVRGRYVGVESVEELEGGRIRWRCVSMSSPGGSIPPKLSESYMQSSMASSVEPFLKWLSSRPASERKAPKSEVKPEAQAESQASAPVVAPAPAPSHEQEPQPAAAVKSPAAEDNTSEAASEETLAEPPVEKTVDRKKIGESPLAHLEEDMKTMSLAQRRAVADVLSQ